MNSPTSMGGSQDSRAGGSGYDWRQVAGQAKQLATDAADLKRQLQQAGVAPKDLTPVDDVVKALQALGRSSEPPKDLQDLYKSAVDKFKALDFAIRKRVDTSNEQLFLSGSEDIPDSFKTLIQEYYRQLAKKGGK